MSSLYDKSINNLKTLQSIQKDEILISSPSRELSIQGEYVQIDNRTELESAIFFNPLRYPIIILFNIITEIRIFIFRQ